MSSPELVAELVARARRGEGAALEALVRRHLRAARAVALSIVQSPADAEDLAQEAFLVAFEQLDHCLAPERFGGWLMQIVRNRAFNALAQQRVRSSVAPKLLPMLDEHAPGVEPDRAGRRSRLLAALEHLSQAQREVVLLHDLEDWTHREIAEVLGTSEGMSRQHLFNARRLLRARLAEDSPRVAFHGS